MLTQKTKDEMFSILRPSMEQYENLKEKIDLFDKLISLAPTCLELNALDTTVYNALNNEFYRLESLDVNEKIFKLILYIVNRNDYNYVIENHKGLASVYKKLNIMSSNDISLMLNGDEDDSDEPIAYTSSVTQSIENRFKDNKRIYPHVIGYIFRNDKAHICAEQTMETKMHYYVNVLISCLNGAWKYHDEIMDAYFVNSVKFKDYINGIITEYTKNKENEKFLYIPSTVTPWNDTVPNLIINNEDYTLINILKSNSNLKKIKIIGYAGAGKTTTLEYLKYQDALKCQKNGYKDNIPVLIRLIGINEVIEDVESLIMKELDIQDHDVVCYLINKKKINVYLDGINEINLPNANPVLNVIQDFVLKNSINVIVSDRDSDSYSTLNNIPTFILRPLSKLDIENFIKGNSLYPNETCPKIMEAIETNKELYNEVTHPYMLKKLVSIVDSEKEVPSDIEELTGKFIQHLIEREEIVKCEKNAKYINRLLMFLALGNDSDNVMGIMYILRRFKKCKEMFDFNADSDDLLNLIVKMGLLKKVGLDQYAFAEENYSSYFFVKAIESGLTENDIEDDSHE